jgi:uncharacterized membrane protein YphA (DoxX/SURF4 family)
LLLLRGLAGFTLIASSLEYARSTNLSFVTGMLVTVTVVSATCLLIGFMTPIPAVLAALAGVCPALLRITFVTSALPEVNGMAIQASVVAVAIALVGPGAFSLDARRFGRREIRIPVATHPPAPD